MTTTNMITVRRYCGHTDELPASVLQARTVYVLHGAYAATP